MNWLTLGCCLLVGLAVVVGFGDVHAAAITAAGGKSQEVWEKNHEDLERQYVPVEVATFNREKRGVLCGAVGSDVRN